MRLVLDTNVFVSALLLPHSLPAGLVKLWHEDRFRVVTAADQIDEIARVLRYPKVRERVRPALAGRLVNQLRTRTVFLSTLPRIDASPDPDDNYLLALAVASHAELLVTGDKRDRLALGRYEGAAIVSVRDALDRFAT